MDKSKKIIKRLKRIGVEVSSYQEVPNTRIKSLDPGQFRNKVYINDLEPYPGDRFYEVVNSIGVTEQVMIPGGNVEYPSFAGFVTPWIRAKMTLTCPEMDKLIQELLFINPDIDGLGIYKMAEFLKKTFNFRDNIKTVYAVVKEKAGLARFAEYQPVRYRACFFQQNSLLTSEERRQIGLEAYHFKMAILNGELIHWEVQELVDKVQYKITKKLVQETMSVSSDNRKRKVAERTPKTFYKYFLPITMRLLKDQNAVAPFKSDDDHHKFLQFVSMEDSMTYREIQKELGVSHNTISKFKKVLKQIELQTILKQQQQLDGKNNI